MNGVFVTGTDTNVGKTIVSAALICSMRKRMVVGYWKPIQTGIESDDDTRTVGELADCTADEILVQGFRLEKALSPHLSARLAEASITVENTLSFIEDYADERFWIVEGAGGVLVPLNEDELMIDLMMALHLPVVVVARSGLGTINHTLLTLEALSGRCLNVVGVVMNGKSDNENRKAIEHHGKVKVLAEMPEFEPPLGDHLRSWSKRHATAFDFYYRQINF
jgi:dethiobiotin synthetase